MDQLTGMNKGGTGEVAGLRVTMVPADHSAGDWRTVVPRVAPGLPTSPPRTESAMLPAGTGCLARRHQHRGAMERLTFAASSRLEIQAVGAHADDIELGAGGAIRRLLAEWPGRRITWVIATATAGRAAEARASAAGFSAGAFWHYSTVADLPDGRLPAHPPELKEVEPLETRFRSQRGRSWWGGDTVRAIARLRGIEAATPLAEAFHARKLVL